jgi:hypothetical protein
MYRVLSIRQPWAWLIVQGLKDVENRTWATPYRGPLLIHASQRLDMDAAETRRYFRGTGIKLPASFETGGIVGYTELVDCVTAHPSGWFQGPVGWVLTNARPLPYYAVKGKLGLFTVTLPADYQL